jgi:inner membrane protein
VTQSWGSAQTLAGPFLAVPYTPHDDKANERLKTAFFLPETLTIEGDVDTQVRTRGIFDVRLYTSKLRCSGRFAHPDFTGVAADVQWSRARLVVGRTEPRALRTTVKLAWDGRSIDFSTGAPANELSPSGIQAPLPLSPAGGAYDFSFELEFCGADHLQFIPVGTETNVSLKSKWPDPSFVGTYLPAAREVTGKGFSAAWKVLALGRNFPGRWIQGEAYSSQWCESKFGISFLSSVDTYQMTERTTKYQLLFFGLTFVTFYAFELLCGIRLHFMQYLLVGAALCMFYLLLLSLSEHVGFQSAYAVAALGVVGMITSYCWAILGTGMRAGIVGGMLGGLYGFLYALLQLQDYALLAGSTALFSVLGLLMFVTRRYDWNHAAKLTGSFTARKASTCTNECRSA